MFFFKVDNCNKVFICFMFMFKWEELRIFKL